MGTDAPCAKLLGEAEQLYCVCVGWYSHRSLGTRLGRGLLQPGQCCWGLWRWGWPSRNSAGWRCSGTDAESCKRKHRGGDCRGCKSSTAVWKSGRRTKFTRNITLWIPLMIIRKQNPGSMALNSSLWWDLQMSNISALLPAPSTKQWHPSRGHWELSSIENQSYKLCLYTTPPHSFHFELTCKSPVNSKLVLKSL